MANTPTDLTKTGEEALYALINSDNASTIPSASPISADNVSLGTPTAVTAGAASTTVVLTAIDGKGYSGDPVTVTYNRLDIHSDVFSVLAPSGATVEDGSTAYATVSDLIAAINSAYSLNLQASDVANGTDAISGTSYPKSATITIADGSFLYRGSLTVAITAPSTKLSDAVATTTLNGANPPTAA